MLVGVGALAAEDSGDACVEVAASADAEHDVCVAKADLNALNAGDQC